MPGNLPDTGWLEGVTRRASPNFNERPPGSSVSLIILHNISLPPGQFGGPYIEEFFQNQLDPSLHPCFQEIQSLQVSAHLLIRRSGELIQFVPLSARAWHAGKSAYKGRDNCNDYSIGIELEGTDELPYTSQQYAALVAVTRRIQVEYPAILDREIVGHVDVAPGRKTDPGPSFDWVRFRSMLAGTSQSSGKL